MPENTVTTTFFADEKAAVAALARLEKKYDELKNAQKHAHDASKHAHHEALHHVEELGRAVTGMVLGGFMSVEGALEKVVELSAEWRQETEAAALSIDKANRSFAIRSGEFGPKGEHTLHAVREAGDQAAVSHEDAERLYGDLKRRGFDTDALLKNFGGIAASFAVNRAASGADTGQFASALVKMMDTQAPKNAAALAAGGRGLFNLTAGTTASAEDVTAFSDILQSLKGGKGEERHRKGLRQLGLQISDVDLIGEDMQTAMQRMSDGLQRLNVEDRMGALKNIAGDPILARKMLAALERMAGNDQNYGRALEVQTSGQAAGRQRAANIKHELEAAAGGDFGLKLDIASNLALQSGESMTGVKNLARRQIAGMLKSMGVSDENAIGWTFGQAGGGWSGGLGADRAGFMKQFGEEYALSKEGFDAQKAHEEDQHQADEGHAIQREILGELKELNAKGKHKPQRHAQEH